MSTSDEKLPLLQRLAFGTGHILNIMAVVGMWFPYSVTFFQKVLLLSPSSTATILLVSQAVGAIVTPFIGIWSDQCVCRYGRRKLFHLIGMICVACSFFFIWFPCIDCEGVDEPYKILYYTSFAIIFQFGWASTQISQLSLVPELTSDKHVKVELNSIRYGVQVASALLVFILMWVLLVTLDTGLVDAKHFGPHTQKSFWVLALIVTIFGFVVSLPFQIFIREKPNVHLKKLEWYKWLKNPQFYLVICTFVAAKLITVTPLTYIPLYFLETLKMTKTSIAIGPLVLYITSCILTPFVKRINKIVGIKLVYFLGIVTVWGAIVWFGLQREAKGITSIFDWRRDDIYFAVVLLGAGGTAISVMSLSFIALLVGEYSGSAAFVYGWAFFGDRLSNGIVNNIILRVQIDDEAAFYRSVIVYVSLVSSILGLIAVVLMKLLELVKDRRSKKHKDSESESQTKGKTDYGSIQKNNGAIIPPIDNYSISTPNGVAVTEQKYQQQPAENSAVSEALQQKSDTVTVVEAKEDELCDLSVYNSV